MLLDADLRARLDRLAVHGRGRVRGVWTGRHRSLRLGESLDFADYREYHPGDDFRRIDFGLWARLGTVLVRLYEAEDELPLQVVVDTSASMRFGGKFESARRLAAMVAYLALVSGERVRMVTVPDGERPALQGPWMRHVSGWPRVESWLEALEPGGGTDLPAAAALLAAPGAHRGPVVVVSDLLAEGWESAVDRFGTLGGGVVLHVLGPDELSPDITGDLTLRDAETGQELNVSVSDRALDRYRARLRGFVEDADRRCRRNGLDYVPVDAAADRADDTLRSLVAAGWVR